jgi:disulfide bond formation protein DsbB
LGKNLVTSQFVVGQSDHDLVEFIKTGRGPDDPLNTTGVTMPPKGNNPTLSDEDLYHIVAYLRTIQK